MGLVGLFVGFGTFVLGFVPNKTQGFTLFFWWAYGSYGPICYWAFALDFVLWQVPLHLDSDAMNLNLGQLLYISDWSKFLGPKLDFILDPTYCIWAYWVTSFILVIGPAGMAINTWQ